MRRPSKSPATTDVRSGHEPDFLTTVEFLPQHRRKREQVVQFANAAEARGQGRLVEMNRQVLTRRH
ncbi:MAG: hypothetical protein ACRDXC_06960 [Acidimicrobiales bacterium]